MSLRYDYLGYAVDVDGDTAVAGAYGNQNGQMGTIYVFTKSGGNWQQQMLIATPPFDPNTQHGVAGDRFGYAVALSGDTMVVGAPRRDFFGRTDMGSAYILTRSGGVWTTIGWIRVLAGGGAEDNFGWAVAIDGDTTIYGAPGAESGQGAAYLFTRQGRTDTLEPDQRLTLGAGVSGDQFGAAVAISGQTAIVGAPGVDSGGQADSGAAYVYIWNGSQWVQQGSALTAPTPAANAGFGTSVSIDGNTVIVGCPGDGAGAAYVFTRVETTWSQGAALTAADGAAGDRFGHSVDIRNGAIVIGAREAQNNGAISGAAYLFTLAGGGWTQQARWTALAPQEAEAFGQSVALASNPAGTAFTSIIGAYARDFTGVSNAGAAYLFFGNKVERIPLGGSANLSRFTIGKVYVPTKWGGNLEISGSNVELFYTDGSDLTVDTVIKVLNGELDGNRVAQGGPCSYAVPENQHGWYYAKVLDPTLTPISAAFRQTAEASTRPWNFYWWASKGNYIREPLNGGNGIADSTKQVGSDDVQVVAQGSPVSAYGDVILCGIDGVLQSVNSFDDESVPLINLFDTGGALEKYDAIYSTSAKAWECVNGQGTADWHGHCLGAAMASILLNKPIPTSQSTLTDEELKGLWAELGEKSDIYTIPDGISNCPAGPPSTGLDATDAYAGKCHRILEQYIKGASVALQSNLRTEGDDPNEVWNHAIWKYNALYDEAPGGNEKLIKVTIELYANADHTPPTNDLNDRVLTYVYIVEYPDQGTVDEDSTTNDWVSVEGKASFALGNLLRVTGAAWRGENPQVTETNVRAVDIAN